MHYLANPARFLRLMAAIRPWAAGIAVLGLGLGLGWGLLYSPPDYQQGETVRIMYLHVPAAWMSLFIYAGMALASAVALIWRHPVAELAAKASAPVGAAFTLICLITGSLWGKPMWGTWWVWDARLTSMLILFFIYLGYMALWEAFDDPQRSGRAAAILALVGAVNLPIIKFSVDWWNTLHQPASVLTLSGPKIHADILWPLLLVAIGCKAYYLWLLSLRVRAEILARQARMLRFVAAGEGAAG
ncbi:heme ABC transporter permease [Ferrovibrio sp.]|uniref:heme ABC transporter permease n=1 Tax=Ferrovibrio sp. TaxID=1917215 RepID=UPI003D145F34